MMEASLHDAVQSNRGLERKYMGCEKDKKAVERKYENVVTKATKITKELRDERQMNTCLRENQVCDLSILYLVLYIVFNKSGCISGNLLKNTIRL